MRSSVLQALRSWKNAKGVALLAIAALAIGIGSTTAIYTVIHAVLLNPLPYANPERYFMFFGGWNKYPGTDVYVSYPDSVDIANRNRSAEAFGCTYTGSYNLVFDRQPLHIYGTQVSPAFFRALGIAPSLGRFFEGQGKEVILSSELWRKLGSHSGAVGKPLMVNGEPYTVVGVMPSWFRYPIWISSNELWLPMTPMDSRDNHLLSCMAKLKPGVMREQALRDFNRVQSDLKRDYHTHDEPDFTTLTPVVEKIEKEVRPNLLLLLAAAISLLLIAAANVASLFLARSVARARDTAVRVALGATNWQLGLHYFSEGLLVSLVGAAAGALLSFALVRVVLSITADEIPQSDQIAFNWQALSFALALAVACGVMFSISPLWQARHIAPNEVLSEGTRASSGAQSRHLLQIFVVTQIALTFVLLAIGGLIFAQLQSLYRTHPGFDIDHLTAMYLFAPDPKYVQVSDRVGYEARLNAVIRALPGVEASGFINNLPVTRAGANTILYIEGRPKRSLGDAELVEERSVNSSYFQAMKIPLLRGRFLDEDDKPGGVVPMLINRTLEKLYWPKGDAVGSHLQIFGHEGRFQIVGVVGDVRNAGLAQPTLPEFYLSYRVFPPHRMAWVIRSNLETSSLVSSVRRAVEQQDPLQTIYQVDSMRDIALRSIAQQRLQSLMVTFFGASALVLAILGIYGVVSYSVRQRIAEMGTRMALGATPRDLLLLILTAGLKMSGIGIAIGLPLVWAVSRLDFTHAAWTEFPPALLIAALTITACTLFASWFPAWRATTLPPMVAIRGDLHLSWSDFRENYRILTERVSEFVLPSHAPQPSVRREILADIGNAESFSDALDIALKTLCEDLGASCSFLLTRREPDQPFLAPAGFALPANNLLLNRLRHYSLALPLSREDLAGWRKWAEEQAPEHLQEIATLEQMEARLAAPLKSKSGINGLLLLGPPSNRLAYSGSERKSAHAAAAELSLLLENGRLSERIVDHERLRRELSLATEVQTRLFPQSPFETPGVQLTGICLPARGVGGDYYDFLDLGNRQVGIALADVAGKGIAAALIMSIVQASLRSLASTGTSLAELAAKMNRLLHRSTNVNGYATFFYSQFDEDRGTLRYVNAGHNPPFLLRQNGEIEELANGGLIIGMFAQAGYEETELQLQPGDVLMAFSDGVSEAHDPNQEEFDEPRLKDLLRRSGGLPIQEMSEKIMGELKTWMADAPQHDDLTFILMRVK